MAIKIGSLLIRLAVEHGVLQEGLARSEKDVAKTTKAIQRRGSEIADFGKNMSLAVSLPMAAIAKGAVDGFIEQQKAMADVNAALASMGDASGKTSGELLKTADALEMRSLFDAEVILKQVTANLLTFGNVAGREFDRAQQAAVDMATRLGGEPQAAAIMLGKALNDPVKGITALTRVGVQFTEQQKAQIKAMTAAGDVAGAQGVILAEVERQFAGAAAAAADASPWREAQVAIGQAMDAIGAAVLPAIAPIGEAIATLAGAFAALPEGVQQGMVIFGALAAVVGPVAIALGSVVSAGAGLLAMLGGFPAVMSLAGGAMNTLLLSPLGLVVGAVAAVVAAWYYWDEIVAVVQRVGAVVSDWLSGTLGIDMDAAKQSIGALGEGWDEFSAAIGAIVSALTETLGALWAGPFGEGIRAAGDAIAEFVGIAASFIGERLGNILEAGVVIVRTTFEQIGNLLKLVASLLRGDFAGAWEAVQNIAATAVRGIVGAMEALFPGLVQMGRDIIAGIIAGIRAAPGAVRDALLNVVQAGYESVKAFLGIRSPSRLFMAVGANISLGLAGGISGAAGAVDAAMDGLNQRAEVQTVAIAQTVEQMAQTVMGHLRGLADGIRQGDFLSILGGIIGIGTSLAGAGVFGAKAQNAMRGVPPAPIPGNANGTAYHPGGLMMVGERGPEILSAPRGSRVVPNHDLRQLGSGAPAVINNYYTLPSDEFWGQVDGRVTTGAMVGAQAGAAMAQGQMAQRAGRRFR